MDAGGIALEYIVWKFPGLLQTYWSEMQFLLWDFIGGSTLIESTHTPWEYRNILKIATIEMANIEILIWEWDFSFKQELSHLPVTRTQNWCSVAWFSLCDWYFLVELIPPSSLNGRITDYSLFTGSFIQPFNLFLWLISRVQWEIQSSVHGLPEVPL